MYDICCIGHITLDKVITPGAEHFMAGGTSFYFSNAIHHLPVKYGLVTSLAATEIHLLDTLVAGGVDVRIIPSAHTVYFENRYSHNQDHRTQRVLQTADPFSINQLKDIDAAVFHLGPLLADDIPPDVIMELAAKGKLSLDVQGYLRKVENENVIAVDWQHKMKMLPYTNILKANEMEAAVLTGEKDMRKAAAILSDWGVEEVVITLGSMGSLIYAGNVFYDIPSYVPSTVKDATGCGDTYMAGYLYQRSKAVNIPKAGAFAAAMAALKISAAGPFGGTEQDVLDELKKANCIFHGN